ncbi:MAG: YabP/YqfC family sporulation protein [Anaerobutyricum soehngenii]
MEERILKSHKISIFNRSSGIISGVKEVISFDPNEIILDTEQGMLMIQGEELHVTKLRWKRRVEMREYWHGLFG